MKHSNFRKLLITAVITVVGLASQPSLAYDQQELKSTSISLSAGQLESLDELCAAYGFKGELKFELRKEWLSMTQDPRVAERVMYELSTIPTYDPEKAAHILNKIGAKGFLRMSKEDIVWYVDYTNRVTRNLPVEESVAYATGSDAAIVSNPAYHAAMRAFFAKEKPEDIVRFLGMFPRALIAEANQSPLPAMYTQAEEQKYSALYGQVLRDVFMKLPKERRKALRLAGQNPLKASPKDLYDLERVMATTFDNLDKETKIFAAYKAMGMSADTL